MYLPGVTREYKLVSSNWSIEYNDVAVSYSLGKGFYASVEMDERQDGKPALVRLPKGDMDYTYEEKQGTGTREKFSITRTNPGKMADGNPIEIKLSEDVDGDNRHFLVGNPYMTYLDMGKFFKENDNLNEKYWVIKDNLVLTNIKNEDGTWKEEAADGTVAPMTAFFIELKEADATREKTITFNPGMMRADKAATATTKSAATFFATNPTLTITVERDGMGSRSVLTRSDAASNDYEDTEDAVTLLDSDLRDVPVVYSIAGDRAVSINTLREWKNIPLGVYAATAGETVTLTFEGMDRMLEPLYLYDAVSKKSLRLEGEQVKVDIQAGEHGRYFLNGGEEMAADAGIAIYSPVAGQVVVVSPERLLRIRVYDVSGHLVTALASIDEPVYTFHLPKGIYLINAQSAQSTKRAKIYVR